MSELEKWLRKEGVKNPWDTTFMHPDETSEEFFDHEDEDYD